MNDRHWRVNSESWRLTAQEIKNKRVGGDFTNSRNYGREREVQEVVSNLRRNGELEIAVRTNLKRERITKKLLLFTFGK